jgi:hypothetical protein
MHRPILHAVAGALLSAKREVGQRDLAGFDAHAFVA